MNSAIDLTGRVDSLMREERWFETIKVLRLELSAVETDWRLSWNLGWCYFRLEKFEQARKHLMRATELSPQNAVCHWALGLVYRMKKQYGQAERNLALALRIKDLYIARVSLALTYLEQGKIKEAESIHLEGIRIRPKESRRYESYACFLEDVGREREAQRMYSKAKKLREIV
jgi:Flp pilus assembly protein TadD